jgi:hypothetical protein
MMSCPAAYLVQKSWRQRLQSSILNSLISLQNKHFLNKEFHNVMQISVNGELSRDLKSFTVSMVTAVETLVDINYREWFIFNMTFSTLEP